MPLDAGDLQRADQESTDARDEGTDARGPAAEVQREQRAGKLVLLAEELRQPA